MNRMTVLLCAAAVTLGGRLLAQEAQTRDKTAATPSAAAGSAVVAVPSPPPVDLSPHAVRVPGPGGSRDRDSAGAGALKGVQARQTRTGEARLLLGGAERTVHRGDLIGTDVVKSIEPGRVLLTRALADGDEATVVVSFDAAGRGRVRIYSAKDHSAALPLPVR